MLDGLKRSLSAAARVDEIKAGGRTIKALSAAAFNQPVMDADYVVVDHGRQQRNRRILAVTHYVFLAWFFVALGMLLASSGVTAALYSILLLPGAAGIFRTAFDAFRADTGGSLAQFIRTPTAWVGVSL